MCDVNYGMGMCLSTERYQQTQVSSRNVREMCEKCQWWFNAAVVKQKQFQLT